MHALSTRKRAPVQDHTQPRKSARLAAGNSQPVSAQDHVRAPSASRPRPSKKSRSRKKANPPAAASAPTPSPASLPLQRFVLNENGAANIAIVESEDFVYTPVPFANAVRPFDRPNMDSSAPAAPPVPSYRHDLEGALERDVARVRDEGRVKHRKNVHFAARSLEVIRPAMDSSAKVVIETLNKSQPGWRGHIKTTAAMEELTAAYGTSSFTALVAHLQAVPYRGFDTTITDVNFRAVIFRSTPIRDYDGENIINDFTRDAHLFARMCPIARTDREHNSRGLHYASVMGAHRQYAMVCAPHVVPLPARLPVVRNRTRPVSKFSSRNRSPGLCVLKAQRTV